MSMKNENAVVEQQVTELDDDVVLDVKDLVVQYVVKKQVVEAVNGISFSLKKGKAIGLVGETGAGKTTTALAIMNLVPDPPGIIKSGKINVCGHDMLNLEPSQLEKIRGKDISMIFQDPMTSLNPVMTVGEQIAESVRLHENVNKQQAIQRALACNPRILIADEPTTALDVTIQAQVLSMMNDLKEKFNTALLMITHDLGVVAKMCDDVAVVYAGRVIESGTLEDVFNNTMHPYTEGLFNSLPNIGKRDAELKPIPGLMPDPTKLPKVGCAFADRCSYATEACREKTPEARYVSDTHMIACVRYDEPDFSIEGWQHE